MFKLLKLKLLNHPILNNCDVDFIESEKSSNIQKLNEPFTTVVIGPNGAGKSQLLRAIIDVFREIEYQKYCEKKKYIARFKFEICYRLGGDIYTIKSEGESKKHLSKNGEPVDISQVKIPNKLLASSFMLNDRFLFLSNETENPKKFFYEYLGIRSGPRMAGTQSYQKKVIETIIEACTNVQFFDNLRRVLGFLHYDTDHFAVTFSLRYRLDLFQNPIKGKDFVSFFKDWQKRRKSQPYSLSYFNKLKDNDIQGIVKFINQVQPYIQKIRGSYFLEYELLKDVTGANKLSVDAKSIWHLFKLDILTYPSMKVKKDLVFSLQDSSSGEYHYLSTIVGLLAKIKNDSLILIDEPELSLHPSWQTKYIETLKQIFVNFSSCHFIIATHSHFMLSDIRAESSSVVSLRRDNESVLAELLEGSTYGWSAEDILFNVFDLPTVRNYYLANEIGDILSLFSGDKQNIGEIKERVHKLRHLQNDLKDIDPLKDVINSLLKKFD